MFDHRRHVTFTDNYEENEIQFTLDATNLTAQEETPQLVKVTFTEETNASAMFTVLPCLSAENAGTKKF